MIVINIGEGLGNQMFQYAFLLKMRSLYPNQIIKIEPRYTFRYIHNGYELNKVFGIREEICSYEEFVKLTDLVSKNINPFYRFWLKRIRDIRKMLFGPRSSFFQQIDPTEYYPDFLIGKEEGDYFFQGIFANYRYFEDIKEKIISTYRFPTISDDKNKSYLEMITSSESVSIHFRRGDYLTSGVTCLDDDYYSQAIDLIENKISCSCTLFVFSDDIEYVRKKYANKQNIVFVEGNDNDNSYIDMFLMSKCKHNIIANSSFSFWGAYLNQNPQKIVISSSKAYNGCANPFSCDFWIKI